MIFGQKWVKILIILSFRIKFDDATVTLSVIVLSQTFFTNSPFKKPFPFLRKIGKVCWGGGGDGIQPPLAIGGLIYSKYLKYYDFYSC